MKNYRSLIECYSCDELALRPDAFYEVEVYQSPTKAKTKFVCRDCYETIEKVWPLLLEAQEEGQ